jgi:hypothetical protein
MGVNSGETPSPSFKTITLWLYIITLFLAGFFADLLLLEPYVLLQIIFASEDLTLMLNPSALLEFLILLGVIIFLFVIRSRSVRALAILLSALVLASCIIAELTLSYIMLGNSINMFSREFVQWIAKSNISASQMPFPPFPTISLSTLFCLIFTINVSIAVFSLPINIVEKYLKLLGKIALVIFLFTLLLAIVLVVAVKWEYTKRVDTIKKVTGNMCSLDQAWILVKNYSDSFISTYKKPWPKPRQFAGLSPVFAAKLAAVSGTGSCLDFALGSTKLLSDVLGCETRVVKLVGRDHAAPEVKVGDTWYVVDIIYTTRSDPLNASDYAKHLKEMGLTDVKGIHELFTDRDLSIEHGFTLSDNGGQG